MILPKAETVITDHHEHNWDRNTSPGKAPDLDCPELSADVAHTIQEKGLEHGWETWAPCKDRD